MGFKCHMTAVLGVAILGILSAAEVRATEVVFQDGESRVSRSIARMARNLPDSLAADSVVTFLNNAGYLDAGANLEEDRLLVTTGRRYLLDRIVVDGDSTTAVSIKKPFIRDNLSSAVGAILDRYYRSGYYYAAAEIDRIMADGQDITAFATVNRGPVVTIKRKILTGLTRTDSDFLGRFIAVSEGDTLTERAVSAAEKSAAAIPFVSFIPPAIVRPREGYTESDLEFRFLEKSQFRFEGGAGYQPDDETGLVWSLNAAVRNLFGRGRQVSLLSERREKGRNRLEVRYRQPMLWLGVGSLGFKVATRDYRDRFYEFAAGADYVTSLNREWSAGIELSWASVEPSLALPSYDRFESGFSVSRETVDNPLNPGRGLAVSSSVAYSHRRYANEALTTGLRQSFNETRVGLDLDFYQPVGHKSVLHVGLNYAGLETSESLPPLSELVLVGGPGTLRGFRNEQFAVLRAACGTIEPRLRFEGGNFFIFYDAAYLNNRISDNAGATRTEEFYRSGYGVGLALTNPGRAVRISLGWNRDLAFDEPRLAVEMFSDI